MFIIRTVIIDNSLCGMKLEDFVFSDAIIAYIEALKDGGVRYIEIDFQILKFLDKSTDVSQMIFRLTHKDDYMLANEYNFAYVCVPPDYCDQISYITRPVLMEIPLNGVSPFKIIPILSKKYDMGNVSLLRFVENFNNNSKVLSKLIHKFRQMYYIPVDICALNNELSAVSAAICAYAVNVDSITLHFGSDLEYGSLENFYVAISNSYGAVVDDKILIGICKAALLYQCITGKSTEQLDRLINHYKFTPQMNHNIDIPISCQEFQEKEREFAKKTAVNSKKNDKTILQKQINNFRFEKKAAKVIEEIIGQCSPVILKTNDTKNKPS